MGYEGGDHIPQTRAAYGCTTVGSMCIIPVCEHGCFLAWQPTPVCNAQRRCSCRHVACDAIRSFTFYFLCMLANCYGWNCTVSSQLSNYGRATEKHGSPHTFVQCSYHKIPCYSALLTVF